MSAPNAKPTLRPISIADLVDVIAAGVRDFRAAPMFGLAFAALYVAAGWLLIALLWQFGMPYFAYPLAMGFALIAPFAATGFYATSEHLEKGKPMTWSAVLGSVKEASRREMRWMALITGFALVIWMDLAAFLMFAFTSFEVISAETLRNLLSTPIGWLFAILGNAAGAVIALAVFSISVVSFPMLYDRDVDFVTAMTTSVNLVMQSPRAMIAWCAIIAITIIVSIISGFFGLLITMPVIGHATWHLYRRAVTHGESAVVTPATAKV